MTNQVRTLLLNMAAPNPYDEGDEYISNLYVPVTLTNDLSIVHKLLFGANSTRATRNATLARIMTVADANPTLYDAVRYDDARITYAPPYSEALGVGNNFADAAEVDPTVVFREGASEIEDELYKVWVDAPAKVTKAAAVAVALARRIADIYPGGISLLSH